MENTNQNATPVVERPKVQIRKAVLAAQVEEGMKKEELMEYYGLNNAQMGKALKAAGLTIRKFHAPAFEFIEEEEVVAEEVAEEVIAEVFPVDEAPITPNAAFQAVEGQPENVPTQGLGEAPAPANDPLWN